MSRKEIIMHYTSAPALEDLHVIATSAFEMLPEELLEFCEDLEIAVEDFADPVTEDELNLEDPFDLLALFCSGKQIAPGVESKSAAGDDTLVLYRRPILDLWCETGEDLGHLVRQVMIEELGDQFDFTEDEVADMTSRHYQGRL